MAHALAALPRLDLDAKRVAATTVVIALHVGVLMMLLAPVTSPSKAAAEEEVINWLPVPPIIRVPPPIQYTPVRPPDARRPPPVAQRQPVQAQDPPVESVDQTASAVDFIAAPDTSATSFDAGPVGPSIAQLSTIAAPGPVYPRPAIQRRLTGTVTLRIHVDAGGRPIEVWVENSSGHAILDQAAMKVVKARWRFVPATQDGVAIEAWALVPIEFVLQ